MHATSGVGEVATVVPEFELVHDALKIIGIARRAGAFTAKEEAIARIVVRGLGSCQTRSFLPIDDESEFLLVVIERKMVPCAVREDVGVDLEVVVIDFHLDLVLGGDVVHSVTVGVSSTKIEQEVVVSRTPIL